MQKSKIINCLIEAVELRSWVKDAFLAIFEIDIDDKKQESQAIFISNPPSNKSNSVRKGRRNEDIIVEEKQEINLYEDRTYDVTKCGHIADAIIFKISEKHHVDEKKKTKIKQKLLLVLTERPSAIYETINQQLIELTIE